MSWLPVSTLAGDAFTCTLNGGSQFAFSPSSVGPYSGQDGPQVETVTCTDVYSQQATASITVTVTAPNPDPKADTFSGAYAGNFETLTWNVSATHAAACYVQQADGEGFLVTLAPGGTIAGSATSGFLSPYYGPFTFTLICDGVPLATVPTITVQP